MDVCAHVRGLEGVARDSLIINLPNIETPHQNSDRTLNLSTQETSPRMHWVASSVSCSNPLNPKPSRGFFCSFSNRLNGPPFGHSWNTQPSQDFAEWASCKPSASHFYWLINGRSSLSTSSWYSHWPPQYPFPRAPWVIRCFQASEVMIVSGLSDVLSMCSGNFGLQVDLQLPVQSCVEGACCHFWERVGLLSSFDEGYCLLWSMMVLVAAGGWG